MTARFATGVALATVVALLAGACGGPPQQQRLPDLDFSDRPAIRLAVANIEIVNAWTMPFVAPHIEHEVPVAPAAAVERWARDVLQAAGGSGSARFVISEGSFTETGLKTRSGVVGLFVDEPSERYEASVRASIEIRDADGGGASATAFAGHSRTARETISLNRRDRLWYDMVSRLMDIFDKEFRTQVERNLAPWRR